MTEHLPLEKVIIELRKMARDDQEFAQCVALSCAAIADRAIGSSHDAAAAIRDFFHLDPSPAYVRGLQG